MTVCAFLPIDALYGWTEHDFDEKGLVHARAQNKMLPQNLVRAVDPHTSPDKIRQALHGFLSREQDYSGGIWEAGDTIIAWADHIRSFPVYYAHRESLLTISNNARAVREQAGLKDICETSATEFVMAGYVTGAHTLYKDLKVLQPGETLIWRPGMEAPQISRYFRYVPSPDNSQSADENRARLAAIIDDIFVRMIERIGDRPVWVPLSAGLDSRLILAKLHEHGVRNIQTFTYGPRFNFEARYAKRIAERLNVPWLFLSFSKNHTRKAFRNNRRKDYWTHSDGLKAIPSMREYTVMEHLSAEGLVPDNAVLINGQSGDYITGLHISSDWFSGKQPSCAMFHDILSRKHFDLWAQLKTPENLDLLKKRMLEICPEAYEESKTPGTWALREEIWEYDARQICLVVHGQRTYDFFGYGWEMPLWDKALVDFYRSAPVEQKKGQCLYREYLRAWNYKGLFPAKEPKIWRWPVPMLWVLPVAKLIQLARGKKKKEEFYARMKYFGHYSNQYFAFPRNIHLKTATQARNVFSLYVLQWMYENEAVEFPPSIKQRLPDIGDFYDA